MLRLTILDRLPLGEVLTCLTKPLSLPISQPASQRATHKTFNSLHISRTKYLTFNSLHILHKKYQTFSNSQQTIQGGDAFDQKLHHLPSTEGTISSKRGDRAQFRDNKRHLGFSQFHTGADKTLWLLVVQLAVGGRV